MFKTKEKMYLLTFETLSTFYYYYYENILDDLCVLPVCGKSISYCSSLCMFGYGTVDMNISDMYIL